MEGKSFLRLDWQFPIPTNVSCIVMNHSNPLQFDEDSNDNLSKQFLSTKSIPFISLNRYNSSGRVLGSSQRNSFVVDKPLIDPYVSGGFHRLLSTNTQIWALFCSKIGMEARINIII